MDELTAPSLIIAMPQLDDPNFERSVVLLIECNEEGAFGLVINRPVESSIEDLCEDLDVEWGGPSTTCAQFGGPVGQEQGFLLHGDTADHMHVTSKGIAPGIHIALDMDSFRALCTTPPAEFRMLLGYAGWAPGQLERELVEGAWLATEVTPELVFEVESDAIWERALGTLGVDPSMLVFGSPGMH